MAKEGPRPHLRSAISRIMTTFFGQYCTYRLTPWAMTKMMSLFWTSQRVKDRQREEEHNLPLHAAHHPAQLPHLQTSQWGRHMSDEGLGVRLPSGCLPLLKRAPQRDQRSKFTGEDVSQRFSMFLFFAMSVPAFSHA